MPFGVAGQPALGQDFAYVGFDDIADVLWQEFSLIRHADWELFPDVFAFSVKKRVCYYVMEYIQGRDLRTILEGASLKDVRVRVQGLGDLLRSLSVLRQSRGSFYHGDIKPENILIDDTGKMRLIDPAARKNEDAVPGMTLTVPYNPLALTGTQERFDITVRVVGGGVSGQAGAIRHGIARALIKFDGDLRPSLKRAKMLTRDARVKERKKVGLKRARKAPQYTKR